MAETSKVIEDPVCGMVIEAPSEHTAKYEGVTYHFCSLACKDTFEAAPKAYTKIKAA